MKSFLLGAIVSAIFMLPHMDSVWYNGSDTCVKTDSEKSLCWKAGDYSPRYAVYSNGRIEVTR